MSLSVPAVNSVTSLISAITIKQLTSRQYRSTNSFELEIKKPSIPEKAQQGFFWYARLPGQFMQDHHITLHGSSTFNMLCKEGQHTLQ